MIEGSKKQAFARLASIHKHKGYSYTSTKALRF